MLLIALSLVILPFLAYSLSTALFYRRVNSRAGRKTPPIVPYFLPGIFHTFTIAYEGPQKYFASLLKDYGSSAPFSVKAGLKTFVVLRDPEHVEKITRQSRRDRIDLHVYQEMFGFPKAALNVLASNGNTKQAINHAHFDLPGKYLTGTALANLTDLYVSTLSQSLNDKMFQFKFWTQIEDFFSFFQQVIAKCMMQTLFGSEIFKDYPAILKDYWKYDEAIEGFVSGLPRPLISVAYEAPRDRLLHGIENWLKNHHSGVEFARIRDDDPLWDEQRGSKFIQERDDAIAKAEGMDRTARAAEIISVLYGSNSSVVPSSFWALIEILRQEPVAKIFTTQISQSLSSSTSSKYDIIALTHMPLVQSILKETERMHVAKCLVRKLEDEDCELDGKWKLSKGTSAIAFSRDIAMNPSVWAKSQSRIIEKPLDQFWPERFLVADTSTVRSRQQQKNEKIKPSDFSMECLEHIGHMFSDEHSAILGHDYVRAMQTATLAVFLTEFELKICDAEAEDVEKPQLIQPAFGRMNGEGKVAIRIRKRPNTIRM